MATLLVREGDYRTYEITITDEDDVAISGGISGWTFKLSLALAPGETPAHEISGTIINATTCVVQFELTNTHTASAVTYYYEVQATTDASKVYTVETGKIIIVKDIAA